MKNIAIYHSKNTFSTLIVGQCVFQHFNWNATVWSVRSDSYIRSGQKPNFLNLSMHEDIDSHRCMCVPLYL